MISQTFAQVLQGDHERLSVLFLEYQKMKHLDLEVAKDFFKSFKEGLEYHMSWEEGHLFPIFEGKSVDPAASSLLDALLNEHIDIRRWLKKIAGDIQNGNIPSQTDEEEFADILGEHNAREEYKFYTLLDKQVSEEERKKMLNSFLAEHD